MKNFILLLIFILWTSYYLVPYQTKIDIFDKLWIDISFIIEKNDSEFIKWEPIILKFDNKKIIFEWNISNWEQIWDSTWASEPNVKCFYSKDYNSFSWSTVLHRFVLLKNKNVDIKITKVNPEDDLNIYVYKTSALSKIFPPHITNVYDCKSSINITNGYLIEMTWNSAPSDIVIWIAWWKWVINSWYILEIEEKNR